MTDERIQALAQHISSKKIRSFFGSKLVFKPYQSVSAEDLGSLENELNANIPDDIKTWIIEAGLGDVNEELAFRLEFFSMIDLHGVGRRLVFAQDILGNFYAHNEVTRNIYYVNRSSIFEAKIAEDFYSFIQEYERRRFQLDAWTSELHSNTTN